jgi:hypothetical protein
VIVDSEQTNNTEAEPFHHASPFCLQNLSKTLFIKGEPSVPISLETLSPNSLMSRAKEVFNVSRLVIIIEARESITHQG